MMIFFLCNFANLIREFQCLSKILEFENSFKPLHAFNFLDLPVRKLRLKFSDLVVGQGGLTGPASHAFSRSKIAHLNLQFTPALPPNG
jgi:hypothetical protein